MKERRLKRSVVFSIYLLLVVGFCVSLYSIEKGFKKPEDNTTYVDKVILEEEIPVVSTSDTIIRPYNSENVSIISNYYDVNADEDTQQNSIIYYDNTYMPNTGVIYGADDVFDVVAIYDGEVIKVEDSSLLGKVVEIRHSNDIISIYQLLDEVTIENGTNIKRGDKIGTSSLSNIMNNNKQKLYFELVVRGNLVNGESCYDKKLNEI